MKKDISELSPEEAQQREALQCVLFWLYHKIQVARKAQVIADQRLQAVFDMLDELCIDPSEHPTAAENATTLKEAISRYAQYGEYTRSGLMREIKAAYGKEAESQ